MFILFLVLYLFNYKTNLKVLTNFINLYLCLIIYNFCLLFYFIKYDLFPTIIFNSFMIDFYTIFSKILLLFYIFIVLMVFKFFFLKKKNLTSNLSRFLCIFPLISFFLFNLISSFNLIFFFLNSEGTTLSIIVLFFLLSKNLNLESILNYYFISVISSIFFLMGLSVFFFKNTSLLYNLFLYNLSSYSFLYILAFFFFILYFFIKLGLFPFNF